MVQVCIAIAAILATVVVLVVGGGDDNGSEEATASTEQQEVFLAPSASPGTDPFTDSMTAPPPTSTVPQATVAPSSLAGSGFTSVDGAHVGLYGGTPNSASCDTQQMIDYLSQNPDKARAWGIGHRHQPVVHPQLHLVAHLGGPARRARA